MPYKKDPIENNGYVGDAHSFGAAEYSHGQGAVKSVNPSSGGGSLGGSSGGASVPDSKDSSSGKKADGEATKNSGASKVVMTSALAILPAIVYSLFI
jgi:hypothetical protein